MLSPVFDVMNPLFPATWNTKPTGRLVCQYNPNVATFLTRSITQIVKLYRENSQYPSDIGHEIHTYVWYGPDSTCVGKYRLWTFLRTSNQLHISFPGKYIVGWNLTNFGNIDISGHISKFPRITWIQSKICSRQNDIWTWFEVRRKGLRIHFPTHFDSDQNMKNSLIYLYLELVQFCNFRKFSVYFGYVFASN